MKSIISKKGKIMCLLTPKEKANKFFQESVNDVHLTNDTKHIKVDSDGDVLNLSPAERAYRSGYLAARSDLKHCSDYMKNKKRSKREVKDVSK